MKVDKWTGEETVAIKDIIAMLNEVLELDKELLTDMILRRFPCSHAVRDHETVQAHCYGDSSIENPKVGFIGLLNGCIGIDRNHFGPIAAAFEKEGGPLTGFKLTDTDDISRKIEEGGQE